MRRGAGGGGDEQGLAGRGGDEEGLAGWGCVSVKCSSTTVGLTMPQHRARQHSDLLSKELQGAFQETDHS